MGGSKKKNLKVYTKRLACNLRNAEGQQAPREQSGPEGVTQKLNRMRAEEARRKGHILSWSSFQASISLGSGFENSGETSYLSENPTISGPRPPSSWISSSINRPNGEFELPF